MSHRNQSLSPIDRASEIRLDTVKLVLLMQSAKILPVIKAHIGASDDELRYLTLEQVDALSDTFEIGERYFLGLARDGGQAYFAWHTSWIEEPSEETTTFDGFKTLREIGGVLDELELALAMHAVGLSNWHTTHPICSRCGAETVSDLGGSVRVCVADSSQHYPRTDPAVIVLVKDAADRILLGHQAIWPEKRFSTFAGFVEPGESFEECVSREVFEEAGVYCNDINYLASQAWPFPASIMIAFEAITDHPDTAKADGIEITEIAWFSRDEIKKAIAAGELLLPPTISVARKMITGWYTAKSGHFATDLIGGEAWRP